MLIESLEGRQLLSASLVGTLASGKLAGNLPSEVPTEAAEIIKENTGGQLISTLAKVKTPLVGGNLVSTLAKIKLADVDVPDVGDDTVPPLV